MARYFPGKNLSVISPPSIPTRRALQHSILDLFSFRLCDSTAKADLERRAQHLARLSTQPVYILREILQYLKQQRIVVPIYTFLQDMVGRVVSAERRRVSNLLSDALTTEISQQLDALLCADESMYRVSILKHEPKDFSYKELRQESERRQFFAPLHEFARQFLETTGISIPVSEFIYFSKEKQVTRQYIIVHHDKLEFPICLFRIKDNDYSALWMKCTHQGSELNASGDHLYCSSHGSEFDSKGKAIHGPAEKNLRSFPITVQGDKIIIELTKG